MPTAAPAAAPAQDTQPWLACPFPGRFTVPTMLTPEEVNYLHWLGQEFHSGSGRVVDLGCFFGGSTVALATGMMANPAARPPLLTYDSFVMDSVAEKMFLHPYRDGESFRPIFDVMTTRVRDAVIVREGWLPESIDRAGERTLYPEQEPIEVLFVDVAKTWNVHLTVLRAFARHLIPGRSILVQQDFKHFYQFWIPIHMHQLRECFRPVHDVPRSATMTFEYVGGLEEALPRLLRPGVVTDAGAIEGLWEEVEGFWAQHSPEALTTIRLNRAMHLLAAGLVRYSLAALHRFAEQHQPSFPIDRRHVGAREGSLMCDRLRRLVRGRSDERVLASQLDGISETLLKKSEDWLPSDGAWLRACLWKRAADECARLGSGRIVLFGAGRHTDAMIRSGWPWREDVNIVAIIDDEPSTDRMHGLPVFRPSDAPQIDAIVVSSDDRNEELIYAPAARLSTVTGAPVVRIYEPKPASTQCPSSSSGMPSGQ